MLRFFRRFPIILHDSFMIVIAWTLAMVVRYDWPLPIEVEPIYWQVLPIVVTVQSIVLWYNGLHQGIWRFTGIYDLATILRSVFIGVLAIISMLVIFNRLALIPRSSLVFFYPVSLIFLLGMPRLLYRLWRDQIPVKFTILRQEGLRTFLKPRARQRVLVLGAGTSGDMLVRDMLRSHDCGYLPVGFLDDEPLLQGGKVQGIPVLGHIHQLHEIAKSLLVDVIVIAIPSATEEQMQQIIEHCETCQIPVRTLPKLNDMVRGTVNLNVLRAVAIEDLLGRAKVQLDWQQIQAKLSHQMVMVSGGGGSIGAELCHQIARLNPTALVIFERCEFNLYQVEKSLRQEFPTLILYTHLGDITDHTAVHHLLACYRPQIVFHAAAYKHVPMLQSQIREAVRNNVLGTQTLAQAVTAYGCQVFVMISTDKAVNPSSIMGATKRAAEIFCQAMNGRSTTRFMVVRFGNVLGSAGSVVPLFQEQIVRGGPVTVTHPEISRYFMTIPEASQLILQAGAMGRGGEIFILDMGKPIKIRYLAEQMIKLSRKVPDRDIKIVYTGLRAGEKLHEELFYSEEIFEKTAHKKILLADHRGTDWDQLNPILQELTEGCNHYAEQKLERILKNLVPELSLSPFDESEP
ncbi:MAG: polysaccharide biosynthesis protein [Beggiatoa sp. IS2]|nr:MAG: polysaccharide biosynthesis protein [Beggiatoa sp. IS2]